MKRAWLAAALAVSGCDSDSEGGDAPDPGTTSTAAATEETGSSACDQCAAAPQCHSVSAGTHCQCEAGYEWSNPTDDADYACVPIEPRDGECTTEHTVMMGGECSCELGFNWCTEDLADLTCCEDAAQAPDETG